MATCGRCTRGQTETAGELCPHCSEHVSATSLVAALSGLASRAGHIGESGNGSLPPDYYSPADHDGDLQPVPLEHEFAGLPPCERPFAADRTVWPAAPELLLTFIEPSAADDDLPVDAEQLDLEQQPRDLLDEPGEAADDSADLLQPPGFPHTGRWIALIAATAVLLASAAATVTLVIHYGRTDQSARVQVDKPSVAAKPSSSLPAIVAPTGSNQLVVDQAAVAAPDEAAVTASLNRYFDAINSHDYLIYKRTFIMALRAGISPASFRAAFGTTTASGEQLHSITVVPGGEVDALVTFISQQPTTARSSDAPCTSLSMHFYLGKRGSRYLLVEPPLWSSASSCP